MKQEDKSLSGRHSCCKTCQTLPEFMWSSFVLGCSNWSFWNSKQGSRCALQPTPWAHEQCPFAFPWGGRDTSGTGAEGLHLWCPPSWASACPVDLLGSQGQSHSMPLPQEFLFLWFLWFLTPWQVAKPPASFSGTDGWSYCWRHTTASIQNFHDLRKPLAQIVTWMPIGRKGQHDHRHAASTVCRNIPNKKSEHFSSALSTAGLFSSGFYLR